MDSCLYQYLVGRLVFAAGVAVAWRTGQVGLAREIFERNGWREGQRIALEPGEPSSRDEG
jgi:hypothetical protein